ncbi:hypothetical protein BDF20DRAFT_878543 [Mycotypha africana]|uniref:uncharacterized protein n=1 Tax=Mycotypha africana TaxID=64632 RepID=UPI002300AE61|nr:uncharacterized protein BDF20DRAFT_878543 [Mycotypha africana]KAI8975411.1 hypothetical protein BDF20DRAFT_878543 [Mycotypha africana]
MYVKKSLFFSFSRNVRLFFRLSFSLSLSHLFFPLEPFTMGYVISFVQTPLYIYLVSLLITPMEIIDLTVQLLALIFTPHEKFLPHIAKCLVAIVGFVVAYTFLGFKAFYANLTEYKRLTKNNTSSADNPVERTSTIAVGKTIVVARTSVSDSFDSKISKDTEMKFDINLPMTDDSDAGGNTDMFMQPTAQSIANIVSARKNTKATDDNADELVEDMNNASPPVSMLAESTNKDDIVNVTFSTKSMNQLRPSSQSELLHNELIMAVDQMIDENSVDHVAPTIPRKENDINIDQGKESLEKSNVTPIKEQAISLSAFPSTPPQQQQQQQHQPLDDPDVQLSLQKEKNNDKENNGIGPLITDEKSSTINTTVSSNIADINERAPEQREQQERPHFLVDIIEPTNGAFLSSLTENLQQIMNSKPPTPDISPDEDDKHNKPFLEPARPVRQTTELESISHNMDQYHRPDCTPSLTPPDQQSSAANSYFSRRSSTISQFSTTAAIPPATILKGSSKLESAVSKAISRSGTKESFHQQQQQQQVPNQVQHLTADVKHTTAHSISAETRKKKNRFSSIRLTKKKGKEETNICNEEKPVHPSSDIIIQKDQSTTVVVPHKSVSTRLQKGFKSTGKRLSRIFS